MGNKGSFNTSKRRTARAALVLALSAAGAGGFSCAPATPNAKAAPVVKECQIQPDQASTLSARWKLTPIPIAFSQSPGFTASELADMVAAADSWNTFAQSSMNMPLIDYGGDPSNPRMSSATKPTTLCAQGIVQGNQFSGQVVIYAVPRWPYTNLQDAIALTSFCPLPAKPLPTMYMAIMEVNYQNFFTAGKKVPDLRTIILHELGHLVGLNHSCETKDKAGFPNCTSPTLNPAYYSAVMFPVFGFDSSGLGEQKRQLTENDQGRANCLYQPTPSGN